MIPKNRITTSILTGASVASATVILSLFEPDRFVLPAVLATAILVFCAPYLTLGRTEGMKEERAYQLGAVEGWRSFHADITGGVGRQGGLGDVGCGRLFLAQRHFVRSGVGCGASDGASPLPGP